MRQYYYTKYSLTTPIKLLISISIVLLNFLLPESHIIAASHASLIEQEAPSIQTVKGDYFAAKDTLHMRDSITGDAYIAGGTIEVDGQISGDLLAAGGTIRVNGTVLQDARIVGGTVVIDGTIGKNLTVIGGTIVISERAHILGNIVTAGGTINILSPTAGNVTIAAGQATLGSVVGNDVQATVENFNITREASIGGNLTYWTTNEAHIDPQSHVGGIVEPHIIEKKIPDKKAAEQKTQSILQGINYLGILSHLLIGLLFIYLFPHLTQKSIHLIETNGGKVALIGFLTIISTPIIILILLISIVGIPIGVATLFIYLTLYYIATFPSITLIGSLIMNVFKKQTSLTIRFLVGFIIFLLISRLPVIGFIISLIIHFLGVGSLLLSKKTILSELRRDKVI